MRPDAGSESPNRAAPLAANAEQEPSGRATYLSAVLATALDGIITIDEDGVIQTVNPATERTFGYVAAEMVGRNVRLLMPEPYASAHDGYLRHYRATGEARIIGIGRDVEGRRSDGSRFPLELAVSEMFDEGRRGFVGIVRDITERREMERMQREFISTISHELRTPLTSIRGTLEIVLEELADGLDPHLRRLLDAADRNATRLQELIEEILDLERDDLGRLEIECEEVDLINIAHQALANNEGYADSYGVELITTMGSQPAMVWADSGRLLQVFANLVSNAIRHSPAGGQVVIGVTPGADRHRATVTDDGPGVPPGLHTRIFDRFVQADSSDTRTRGGTGLGLSIARAIVELHGGLIDLVRERESGSEFYFELPAWHGDHHPV